jgi:probable phosphoglycerate mutase
MIYLVRHGQTVFNAEGRFQGQSDSPLTTLGETQARRIGRRLRDLVGDDATLVASPLGRTQHTARIIAEALDHRRPIQLDARLAEVTMGVWDGMTGEDIDFAYPGARDGLSRFDWWFHSPDGESHTVFCTRLADWLAEAQAGPKPLVTVSHGGASRVLRGLYLGLPKEEALRLDTPQDAIFRFHQGQIERIDCGA